MTRAHEDVDVIFPRHQHELRHAQLAELGSPTVDGVHWIRIHRRAFTVGGQSWMIVPPSTVPLRSSDVRDEA